MRMIRKPSRRSRERGSAMVAVVAITMVTAVVAIGVTTLTVGAIGTTSSSKSAVQAQASAESGIAATIAALNTNACQATYARNATPVYSVAISWSNSASGPWTAGCPTATSPTNLRLLSSGSSLTAAGGGLGVNRYVEAVYSYTPTVSTTTTTTTTSTFIPSGAAMYSYSSANYSISGLTLNKVGTAAPSVMLRSGKFVCASSSVINGDVIAAGGDMNITGSCTVKGNASASGSVILDGSGNVTGNVSASSTGSDGYSVSLKNSGANVGGSISAAGPVLIQAIVGGNVTAAGPSSGTSMFQNSAHINGFLTVAGNLNAQGMGACDWNTNRPETNTGAKCIMQTSPKHVDGAINYQQTGLTAPAAPVVPGWSDYTYKASDWAGYSVVTLSAGDDCNWSWSDGPGIVKLKNAAKSTTPTIIDARACDLSFWASVNPVINANMVIVAKSFNMGSNTFTSANNTPHNMWFIVSDPTADAAPTCSSGDININGSFNVSGAITALAYTPCTINQSSTTWHGQMYANTVVMNANQVINYEPIGLPGVNLDTGGASTTTTTTTTQNPGSSSSSGQGTLALPALSYRDVSSAG